MSIQGGIKWRKQDTAKLSAEVRKFNAKLTRMAKKNPHIIPFLPERKVVSEIKKQIATRSDFNKEIRSLERIMKPKQLDLVVSKEGAITTRWMIYEVRRLTNEVNAERARRLEKLNPSTERGTMGSVAANNLSPKKFDFNRLNQISFSRFIESVEKQSRKGYTDKMYENYRLNYIKALRENVLTPNNSESITSLIKRLMNITAEEMFTKGAQSPLTEISYVYDEHEADFVSQVLESAWEDILNE